MTQEMINEMVNSVEKRKNDSIETAKTIVREVLAEYDKLHNGQPTAYLSIEDEIENGFTEDERNAINIIRERSSQPNWPDSHDDVFRIMLELRHSVTFRRFTKFADIDLISLGRNIDIDVTNIRAEYEKKYLDSPVLEYDGDLVICDPALLISEYDEELCPSLYKKNILDSNTPFYTVIGNDENILGVVTVPTENICTVLAKDIWSVPSAEDALKRMDITYYTFIRQFHGTVQFFVDYIDGKYVLRIEGKGNKPFRLRKVTV